jgi:hypothetical protein
MRCWIFSKTSVWNIFHSKKNPARYCRKCISVSICSTHSSCQIFLKLEFSIQIFEKSSIKFHENLCTGSRVTCGRTDRETGVTKLIVGFCNSANAPKNEWVFAATSIIPSRRSGDSFSLTNCDYCPVNILSCRLEKCLELLFPTVGVLVSSDAPETSHREYIHSWFSSALPGKLRDIYLKLGADSFRPYLIKVAVSYDKVIYSVKHNTYIVINTQLATCCGSSKQSSSQYLIYGHGTFSECALYGIPYCLKNHFYFKLKLKIYCRCIFQIYVKTPISSLLFRIH